jgi:hypothetical protein
MFRKPAVLPSSGRDAPNLENPLDRATTVTGYHGNAKRAQIKSTSSDRKRAIEKLKTTTTLKKINPDYCLWSLAL